MSLGPDWFGLTVVWWYFEWSWMLKTRAGLRADDLLIFQIPCCLLMLNSCYPHLPSYIFIFMVSLGKPCVLQGPMTFPGDPWSLSRQKSSNFAKMLGTNPDKIGPKCSKSQISDPDRSARKHYSMSINPDKYQPWCRNIYIWISLFSYLPLRVYNNM